MIQLPQLRQLYMPIQPTVRQTGGQVSYQEQVPAKELEPFIYCYWQLKTSSPLDTPFSYRVVSDGCMDIFFSLKKPSESFVMGFCKQHTSFSLDTHFDYIGIRFLPTMLPQLLKIDATSLSNRYEWLHAIAPEIATFIEREHFSMKSFQQICSSFNEYFAHRFLEQVLDFDKRLYDALDIILQKQGMLQVQGDLDVGMSSRQLRRVFNQYIGATPKTFSQVVRFQNILRAKPSRQSLRKNKLFFDKGYFDQAHFVKEFKTFYGLTPSAAFGR